MAYASDSSTSICEKFVHSSVNKIRSPVNVVKVSSSSFRPSLVPLPLTSDPSRPPPAVDARGPSGADRIAEWRVHPLERAGVQLRDHPPGQPTDIARAQPDTGLSPGPLTGSADSTPLRSRLSAPQAHDTPIRSIAWARSSRYLLSSDDSGQIKYFQSNMNNLAVLPGHAGHSCRGLAFGSGDSRFVSAGDDGFIRIWGFEERREERGWRGTFAARLSTELPWRFD